MIPGYTLIAVVGRGAATAIHKAKSRQDGKVYAIKQLKLKNDPEGLVARQIQTEYEVGRQLDHTKVRRIHALQRQRKLFKVLELDMVMEWLEGQTLGEIRTQDHAQLVRVFRESAEALQAMHEVGFVHADIKPDNIMICTDGGAKVIDLGQSCKLGSVKQRIQGTPDFIAPEQVLRLPLSERTDVFNLGATMYWSLTGTPFPTRIKSKHSTSAHALGDVREVPTPQECDSRVPTALSSLVMDCCRNSPASRPATMADVLERLDVVAHVLDKKNSNNP